MTQFIKKLDANVDSFVEVVLMVVCVSVISLGMVNFMTLTVLAA